MTQKNDFQKHHEPFWLLFLAGTYALITFALFLNFQAAHNETKSDDFNFYILGWAFFVPLGIGMAALAEKLHSSFLKRFPLFSFMAAFSNFAFLLYLLCPATWISPSGWIRLGEFLFLQLCLVLIVKSLQSAGQTISPFLEKSLMGLMVSFFVVWVLSLTPGCFIYLKNASILNLLISCLIVSFLCAALFHQTRGIEKPVLKQNTFPFFRIETVYYLIVLFLIVALVIDPNFEFNRYHYAFFLGPLADFQNGKSFLVNINAQYGVLIFYFLSLFFKILPLGFESFCFVLMFLFIAQYFCFYFILRRLFNSRLYSFVCLIILLMVNYFATMGRMTDAPSIGPLRFGFIYLLLILVILRNQHAAHKKYFYLMESAAVAIAVFWSFEVCIYTLPAYLGLIFYESIGREKVLKIDWKLLRQRIAGLTGFCFLFLFLVYGDVYRRTQEWPHWAYYFDYISIYKNEYRMFFVPALGGWWLIMGILLVSLLAVWGSLTKWKNTVLPSHFNAMVLLTFYAIFQFFYFLGRPHPNNLFHISMPSILLGSYWLYWLRKTEDVSVIPSGVKKSVFALSLSALIIYLPFLVPAAAIKLSQSLKFLSSFPQKTWAAARDLPRDDDFAKTADSVMAKYSGPKKKIIYLFGDRGLEVSLYTNRFNLFPYNDIAQAVFCPPVLQRVLTYQPPIYIGDYIYVSKDMDESYYDTGRGGTTLSYLEQTIFYQLTHSFNLKLIEQQKGISVYQVAGLKPRSS